MEQHETFEILTERVSALVRQFGLDTKQHGLVTDPAMAKGIDQLLQAVHHLQQLAGRRRQERASQLEANGW